MAGKGGGSFSNVGLLILRAGVSGMLIVGHGWPKLAQFAQHSHHFPDPLHIGTAASLGLTVFAEVGCAACVLLGFATRYAVVPILIQFGVIILVVSGGQPLAERELAVLYALPFAAIGLLGPGRFSIDGATGAA